MLHSDNSASRSSSRSAWDRIKNVVGGRRPFRRQFVTDCWLRLVRRATAVVPPSASMTSLGVVSAMQDVLLHPEFSCKPYKKNELREPSVRIGFPPVEPHDESNEAIGFRLELAREALGVPDQQTFARTYMGITPQAYTNMLKGRARPSLNTAIRMHKRYSITMAWVYFGSTYGMPQELAMRLDQLAAQPPPKGRPPRKKT